MQRLFDQQPAYSLLHTFGCACWPNLQPYNTHKLAFCSTHCVFLGYHNLHKGYKCLEPSSGLVYISCDVIFDEIIFPFSSLHPNIGAHLKADILLLHPTLHNSHKGIGVEGSNVLNPVDTIVESFADTGELSAMSHSQEQQSTFDNEQIPQRDPVAIEYSGAKFRVDRLPVEASSDPERIISSQDFRPVSA
jgi:hypothetical protein